MKPKKSLLLNLLIAFLVSSTVLIFSEKGFLHRLELASFDLLFRLRGPVSSNPRIVLIEIDDANILQVGRWPWPRSWHAAITKALKDFGAKYIYFDIIFSEASSSEDDALFSEAIKNAGNIYLPFVFTERPIDIKRTLFPIKNFAHHLKGSGSINIFPDIDGTLRRVPLLFGEAEDELHLSVSLKIAMDYADLKLRERRPDYLLFSSPQGNIKIPLIEKNTMLINWLGKWKQTFTHYSFLDTLNAYGDFLENKKSPIDLNPIKNSICIVAVTAIGLYDIKPTPLEGEYPAVGVIATTISNILDRKFIAPLSPRFSWLLIYLLSFIPSLFIWGEKPLRETFSVGFSAVVFFLISFISFKNQLWIDFSLPLFSLATAYLLVATYNFFRVAVERRSFFNLAVTDELTSLFNIRYFKMVLRAECLLVKAEPTKKFCIIMSDIDHFKHFNDTYGHQVGDLVLREVACVLKNSVRSADVVSRYGGEEMIILLRGAHLESAMSIAEKIRKDVQTHLVKDEKNTYNVTLSLGVACFRLQDNEETVIQRADSGLYKAKDSGRNRVETVENLP